MRKLSLVAILFISFSAVSFSQERYVGRVFEDTEVLTDSVYSNADSWDAILIQDSPEDILLDVYMPVEEGDNLRPAVMCLFGGAFLAGSKDMRPDILAWCDSLSHFGYVAIAIDYRIGFNPASGAGGFGPAHGMKRAAWRAVQDCNSAIDFLKENHEIYRIDTNQIFLLGNSAGSITAINTVFLGDDERYVETEYVGIGANNADLGDLNDNSFFPNHTNRVAGVVGLWGATMDFDWFDEGEQVPMLFIHGDDDNIVLYDEGMAFNFGSGTDINIYLYGSEMMHEYFDSLGWENEFHLYPDQPHAFYSCGDMNLVELEKEFFPCEQWEPVFNQVITWLSLHNNYYLYSDISKNQAKYEAEIYPNPAQDILFIKNKNSEAIGIYCIYDITGRKILSENSKMIETNIDVSDFSDGIYFIKINDNQLMKFIIR
jgi:acetyl esterase/lipase